MLRALIRSSSTVTVPSGPNAGLKIKCSINNRNPRNLEMLNIAKRDSGWGVGPTFRDRYMKASDHHKNADNQVKRQLINMPHNHGYHHITIKSTKNELIAECRHYDSTLVVSASSTEEGLIGQLVSPTDIIAHYAVGRVLGVRMQMAGITNATYPLLSAYTDDRRAEYESKLDFASGVEEEGITIERELDEDSEWHQVEYTEKNNDDLQTFTRGQTPWQIKNNRGDMPE